MPLIFSRFPGMDDCNRLKVASCAGLAHIFASLEPSPDAPPRDALNLQKVASRAGLAFPFANLEPSLDAPDPQKFASQGCPQSSKSRFSFRACAYFC